jgi:hypothetical protein
MVLSTGKSKLVTVNPSNLYHGSNSAAVDTTTNILKVMELLAMLLYSALKNISSLLYELPFKDLQCKVFL